MIRLSAILVLVSWLGATGEDPRSTVVVDSDCQTEITRRRLTLFANGTLRLRDGLGATRTMRLVELGDDEMTAYLNRLREIRYDDLAPHSRSLEGDWVESCRLEVAVPDLEARAFEYGRFDTVTLGLRQLFFVVDDLVAEFDSVREAGVRTRQYKPKIRDIVTRRRDGARFEVLGFTLEGTGVELQGIDLPITVYVLLDSVLDEFDPPDPGENR